MILHLWGSKLQLLAITKEVMDTTQQQSTAAKRIEKEAGSHSPAFGSPQNFSNSRGIFSSDSDHAAR